MLLRHKQRLAQFGLFLLYLAALAPMFNAIRIWIAMPTDTNTSTMYYFAKIGPFNLFLAGLLTLINIIYFLLEKNKISWFIQFFGILWIGGNDTIGAYFFYLDSGVPFLPTMLPLVVTVCNFIGLGCVKNYVFSTEN